jgi:hypothetical protein
MLFRAADPSHQKSIKKGRGRDGLLKTNEITFCECNGYMHFLVSPEGGQPQGRPVQAYAGEGHISFYPSKKGEELTKKVKLENLVKILVYLFAFIEKHNYGIISSLLDTRLHILFL